MSSESSLPPPNKKNTIVVKHLPDLLTYEDIKELFGHYGATEVRRFEDGKLRNTAFVDFECEEAARSAIKRFNFLHLFGKVLSAEFATPDKRKPDDENTSRETSNEEDSDLLYCYPPPNAPIIANICSALVAFPKFYTQVLHLMNKMNLPPPFTTSISPLPFSMNTLKEQDSKREKKRRRDELLSSSESELDSSDEEESRQSIRLTKKSVSEITSSHSTSSIGVIEDIMVRNKSNEFHDRNCISTEALLSGRVPQYEWKSLFPNYETGAPSCKLYIKNISKVATENDLYFIFSRFCPSDEDARSNLKITLFQSGKMKGQAFVTLSTQEQAIKALNEVHAYKLHNQPLIIQFARSVN